MNYFLFGGSGFIGTNMTNSIIANMDGFNDIIYILDLVEPRIDIKDKNNIIYKKVDVRKEIDFQCDVSSDDIIFNFAAIHRTPGHEDYEYFDTNVLGAQNVVNFAEKHNINKIIFTSSIAVYGASEEKKFEETMLTPNTPYGISKVIAESIFEKWQLRNADKRILNIFRPGVVFGFGENGNFTRMISSIKGNYFFYPGRKDTIKACIYVKELVNFFNFCIETMKPGVRIYNCTYEPAYTVEEICESIKETLSIKRHTFVIPSFVLLFSSYLLLPFFGKKIGIHPQRVRKLMVSTNISGLKMKSETKNGYQELYDFKAALVDLNNLLEQNEK
ncbi:MAG: NAD(P)-dependent oxidoreductase [Succinivibrionaceae bacterium]|nr:NAD(P)-dependent oxidoreductase [Succinivibrionaceae bacterium]